MLVEVGEGGWLAVAAFYAEGLLLWLCCRVSVPFQHRPANIQAWAKGPETYRGRRARTPIRVLDIHARPLSNLLQQKRPLDAQLVELAAQAVQAQPRGVVVLLHLVVPVAQLAAFPAVGLLDRGRERLRDGVGWGDEGLRVSLGRFAGALGRHCGGR